MKIIRTFLLAIMALMFEVAGFARAVGEQATKVQDNRKVICVGETVVDILFRGDQPISATPGGSAFNSAISLGRTGIPTIFVGEAGDDRIAKHILRFMTDNGVNGSYVRSYPNQKSTVSLAYLDDHNEAEYSFYNMQPQQRQPLLLPDIQADDILLFGSFYAVNPSVHEALKQLVSLAQQKGAIIYYDVNIRAAHANMLQLMKPNIIDNFQNADIVRGSRGDLRTVFDSDNADSLYNARINKLCPRFINTGGAYPVKVFCGKKTFTYPVKPIQPVSTIGAGDNFNAGVAFALIHYGITRSQLLKGLSDEQWQKIIDVAQQFSQDCCMRLENYVGRDFKPVL
ncbi:MAG: PfkB family carbohydrate kinase [Prevotella sp.]|nr:PfkB family carbohydrate kinase [Prevotella sp.]